MSSYSGVHLIGAAIVGALVASTVSSTFAPVDTSDESSDNKIEATSEKSASSPTEGTSASTQQLLDLTLHANIKQEGTSASKQQLLDLTSHVNIKQEGKDITALLHQRLADHSEDALLSRSIDLIAALLLIAAKSETPTALEQSEISELKALAKGSDENQELVSGMLKIYSDGRHLEALTLHTKKRVKRSFKKTVQTMIIARRLSSLKTVVNVEHKLTDSLTQALADVDTWEFDIWKLHAVAQGNTLSILATHIFDKLNLFVELKLDRDRFILYMQKVEQSYNHNPYHSAVHGADVLQNIYFFMTRPSMKELIHDYDFMTGLFAASIHDIAHPGVSNKFLHAIDHDISLIYNDISVLENMHISKAYTLLRTPELNWMANVKPAIQKNIRTTSVAMVLSTDMNSHFADLSALKKNISEKQAAGKWFEIENAKDRLLCMETALHCSDLGNPAKAFHTYDKWNTLLFEEFANQGDRERELGLSVSAMMDRANPNMEKSQVFFIGVIVLPLYEALATIIPEIKVCVENLKRNQAHWKDVVAKMADAEAEKKAGAAKKVGVEKKVETEKKASDAIPVIPEKETEEAAQSETVETEYTERKTVQNKEAEKGA